LVVQDDWVIPADELSLSFVRSRGPGGQNVNKLSTKAELRFELQASVALNGAQKLRFRRAFPTHVSKSGVVLLSSDRFRSRLRNEGDVLERLAEMLRKIRRPPKRRVPTRASRASQRQRVELKRQQGQRKRDRARREFE
jgi:ribosome-associated protein